MTRPDPATPLISIRSAAWMFFVLLLALAAPAGARAAGASAATFASPEEAAQALASAWRSGSKPAILKIFGKEGARLVSSGDAIADKNAKARLAASYDAQHRIEPLGEGRAQLVIGKEEFPFPIPLVKRGNAWRFDTRAGREEILNRRIGRNELNAIEVCRAYVEAQQDYAAKDALGNGLHEYAMKIASREGGHDGLYWQAGENEEQSPFGPLIAGAAAEGYGQDGGEMLSPYHGYYYRILTQQGTHAPGGAQNYIVKGHMTKGYALVAFPAEYGNSGVMTFIVNQDGIVFEKNLGPATAKLARQMTLYDPDRSWKVHN